MTPENSSVKENIILALLLQAVVFAVYCKALSYGFLNTWDDPAYVVKNTIAHGFSLENVKMAFSRFYVGNYAPLHIISYMFDYTLWGLNPRGYILSNILLHGLNGYLLIILLRRLSLPLYSALLAAGIFLLHPVQVESVVWISQRKNVLAMFFFLLAFYCYAVYRDSSGSAAINCYILALVFFACALLTKSVAVILPPALLIYDICITRRKLTTSITDKLPFIFLAFAVAYLAMLSQSHEYGGGGRTAFHGGSAWATLLTMLPVMATYLRMAIAPYDLSIVYAPQIRSALDGEVMAAFGILCLLAVFGWWLFKRSRTAFFWYTFVPLAITPVSQIVPLVTLMNDRYLYFPMLGIAACFGIGVRHLREGVNSCWRPVFAVVPFIVVAVYGFAAFQRTAVWQNPLVLWSDAAQKQPGSAVAWIVLGEVHDKKGDAAKALACIEKAKDICRGVECYHALEKLTALYLKNGNHAAAELSAADFVRSFPESANGYILQGYLSYQQGDLAAAERLFSKGISIDPNQPSALNALGNIYLATDRPALAVEKLKAALQLEVSSAELFFSLACAEAMLRNNEAALNYLDRALSLGYNRQAQIMKSPEIALLRSDPAFKKLMGKYFRQ